MKTNAIVVIQTAFIGDVILSIPFFLRLKKLKPEIKIVLVAKKNVAQYLLIENIIDHLIEVEKSNTSSYKNCAQFINTHFVVQSIFCIHKSLRSTLLSLKINSSFRYGFKNLFNFLFFTKCIDYPKKFPDVIRQLSLLTLIDQELKNRINDKDWSYLNFSNDQGYFEEIPDFALFGSKIINRSDRNNKIKISIFPGSVWATKRWPIESYILLCQKLSEDGHELSLLGGPEEAFLTAQIAKKVVGSVDLAGHLSLPESINFLKSVDLVVGNDSASSHLAAAVTKPVVAIFGPTVLSFGFRPWSPLSAVVQNLNLNCRPCGAHGPMKCPLTHHNCMKMISVDQVYNQIKSSIDKIKAQSNL